MARARGYLLDGSDIATTYGIIVKRIEGLKSFLARKGELYHSWPDEDGEEAYSNEGDIYFHGRDVTMWCYLIHTNEADFNFAWRAFKGAIEQPGLRTLRVPYGGIMGDTYTEHDLLYVTGSDIKMVTPTSRTSYWAAEFWLRFRETSPSRS